MSTHTNIIGVITNAEGRVIAINDQGEIRVLEEGSLFYENETIIGTAILESENGTEYNINADSPHYFDPVEEQFVPGNINLPANKLDIPITEHLLDDIEKEDDVDGLDSPSYFPVNFYNNTEIVFSQIFNEEINSEYDFNVFSIEPEFSFISNLPTPPIEFPNLTAQLHANKDFNDKPKELENIDTSDEDGGNSLPSVSNSIVTGIEDTLLTLGVGRFTSAYTDADNDDLSKIKIASLANNGNLKVNGVAANVNDVVTFTQLNNNQFTFDPDEHWNGNTSFTWKGHDGTSFSSVAATMTLSLSAVNDAPTLSAASPALASIDEDSTGAGTTVASIVDNTITDVDSDVSEGVAIYATTGNGTWNYSIDNGANWSSTGAVNSSNALLLRGNDQLRYSGDNENGETATFSYYAWDQTSGSAGSKVDVSSRGGNTAFSNNNNTASITVTAVNDAPVLDNSTTLTLDNITEDDSNPTGNTVANILSSGGDDPVTDVDSTASEGIAVIGVDNSNGTWQYNTGGGWTGFGAVSNNAAILLAPDASVRFVPNANYNGSAGNLTFRAWDQTSGNDGDTGVDVSTNGDTTAFSSTTETATLTVTAVNDAPAIANLQGDSSAFTEDGGAIVLDTGGDASVSDVDDSNYNGGYLSAANTNGTANDTLSVANAGLVTVVGSEVRYDGNAIGDIDGSDDGTNGQNLRVNFDTNNASDNAVGALMQAIRFNNSSDNPDTTSRTIRFNVNDGESTSTNADVTVPMTAINDAPEVTSADSQSISLAGDTSSYLVKSNVNNFPTDKITMELWAKSNNTSNSGTLVSYAIGSGADANQITLFDNAQTLILMHQGGSTGFFATGINMTEDQWHHIAFSWDSPNEVLKIYQDGAFIKELSTGAISGLEFSPNGTLVFGQDQDSLGGGFQTSQSFNGMLSDIRIWNDIRTDSEVSDNINGTLTPAEESNLVSYYPFTEGSGSTAADATANNNDLTINNGVWAASFTEDEGAAILFDQNDFTVTDIDDDSIASATVTIDNLLNGTSESLSATTTGTNITASYNSDSGVLELTGSDTFANYEQVLRSVTYNNTSQNPDTTDRTIQVVVNDGNTDSTVATGSISIASVNDAPTVSDATLNAAEDTTYTFGLADFTGNFSDIDNDSLTKIQITALPTSGSLKLNDIAINVNDEITIANISDGLFTYAPDANANGDDTFTWKGHDGTTYSASAATMTMDVAAVNDAPINTVPDAQTTNEEESLTFSDANNNQISTSDIEASTVEVTLLVDNGKMTLSDTTGLTFTTGNGRSNATMTFSGSITNVNNALNGLVYTPDVDFAGDDTLQITTSDLGDSGSGGTLTDTDSITISVTNVNDAPVLDNSGTMTLSNITEDDTDPAGTTVADIISSAGGDRITDVDDGDPEGIAVTGVDDTNGTWQYSTDGVSWTSFGAVSDNAAVLLASDASIRFVPDANYNGSAGDITFRAWDQTSGNNGDTNVDVSTNGGSTAFSTATETATLTVTAVNDASTITDADSEAVSLAGNTSSYLSQSSFSGLGTSAISVEMWINSQNTSNNGTPLSYAVSGSSSDFNEFIIFNNAEQIYVKGTGFLTDITLEQDQWHHLAVTWDGTANSNAGELKIYLDGTLQNTINTGFGSLQTIRDDGTLILGQEQDSLGGSFQVHQSFNGNLADVRIWNDVRSDTEITDNINTTLTPGDETNLAGYYQFDEGTGTTAGDTTANDNDLTLSDGASWANHFTEGDSATLIFDQNDFSITDIDDTNITEATVAIDNLLDGTSESLSATTTGTNITASYNSDTGVLTLTGSDTLANYEQVLRSVTYSNSSNAPDLTTRTIEVTINDGTDTATATGTVEVNNAVWNLTGDTTVTEGQYALYTLSYSGEEILTGSLDIDVVFNNGTASLSTFGFSSTDDFRSEIMDEHTAQIDGVYRNDALSSTIKFTSPDGGTTTAPTEITFAIPIAFGSDEGNSFSVKIENPNDGSLTGGGTDITINTTIDANGATSTQGTTGDDNLTGTASTDYIYGDAGNDTINGSDGADYLYGEAGNDTIRGGLGNDSMIGGTGNDTFNITLADIVAGTPETDTIVDFTILAAGDEDNATETAETDILKIDDLLNLNSPTATELDDYLSFTHDGSKTTVHIDSDGATNGADETHHNVELTNLDLSVLYSTTTEETIIQNLLDAGALDADNSS